MTNDSIALSVKDFCARAGIGRTRVYEEIAGGRLATKKVGRRTIITAQAANEWLTGLPDGRAACPSQLTSGFRHSNLRRDQ